MNQVRVSIARDQTIEYPLRLDFPNSDDPEGKYLSIDLSWQGAWQLGSHLLELVEAGPWSPEGEMAGEAPA